MIKVDGGVCAPKGFKASGIHCGIKKKNSDLAVIVSEKICNVSATYTTNKVKAAPLYVTMKNLQNSEAIAIVANSGNANACATDDEKNAKIMCEEMAKVFNIDKNDVVVASTGIIGERLPIEKIVPVFPNMYDDLSKNGSNMASKAIMTTDTYKKEIALQTIIGGKAVTIGAIAKGSGMIHPNMGTMLSFITTDCNISKQMLQKAHKTSVKKTYNRVSVDGDTSTNDMCVILANGLAQNQIIDTENDDYKIFFEALHKLNTALAKLIAKDGEGCTKLITCKVSGAKNEEIAETLAKSVASSSLVKSAMFGSDANWGRVLCALGYSGVMFNPKKTDIKFSSVKGEILVCEKGIGVKFDEDKAKEILLKDEVTIDIDVNDGDFEVTAWGCDLTYDYVKINGDYRS